MAVAFGGFFVYSGAHSLLVHECRTRVIHSIRSLERQMQKSRFIVGLLLIGVAVLILVFGEGTYSTAGVMGLGVLGLILVAISRRKSDREE